MRLASSRLVRGSALALACLTLGACRSKSSSESAPPVASVADFEEPAPRELLAELTLGNPKATWQRLRLLGGDMAEVLPTSLPVLLATSLSLPPAAAGNLDEALPAVGALLARGEASEPDVVLGMHVVSGSELIASLTLGDGAKFRSIEVAPRIVRLLPAPGAPEFDGALGVSGNYLLLATRNAALTSAGRFVAEVLPKRASPEPGLRLRANQQVLSGSIARVLRQAWQARRAALAARDRAEREAKGRAPDFADPAVLLGGMDSTVESWLGVLESSREVTVEVVPEVDRLRATLSLTPDKEGAAALLARDLVTGSLDPLLTLPASTRAALLTRSAQKGADLAPGSGIAQLLGERLDAKQTARLNEALAALGRACGGAIVLGWVGAPAPALSVDCQASDAAAFSDAVGGALRLVQLPALSTWLTGTVGQPTLTLAPSVAPPARARLQLRSARRAPSLGLPSDLRLAWDAHDGVGHVVVSSDAKLGPAALAEGPRLAAASWLAQSQADLGNSVALALYVDVGQLLGGTSDPAADARVLLAFGKRADSVAVTLDAAPGALRALAHAFR